METEPVVKKFCGAPSCQQPHHAKGLCSGHYNLSRARPAAIKRLARKTLCCQFTPDSEHGIQWFSMPDGKPFSANMARHLVETQAVVPAGDGLFGDSQTYRVRESA